MQRRALCYSLYLGGVSFLLGMYYFSSPSLHLPSNTQAATIQALFTPQDDIKGRIIDLIKGEQKGIKAAMYYFTDYHIARELIKAKRTKNIPVELITDPTHAAEATQTQIWKLVYQNIPVHVVQFPPKKSGIMHHKFFIFENNESQGPVVVTGSFNATHSAQKKNHENVVVIRDTSLFHQYQAQFDYLKTQAILLS